MSKANERLREKLKKRIIEYSGRTRWETGEKNIKRKQLLHERGRGGKMGSQICCFVQKNIVDNYFSYFFTYQLPQ